MSTMEENLITYHSRANNIIDEIKEKLKNLGKVLEEPEYKYKEHCNFLRGQVNVISENAINEINDYKQRFFQEIDLYEIKCKEIAEQEQLKKLYIQELINKSNEKLLKWQVHMENADNVEKSLASINLNDDNDEIQQNNNKMQN